MDGECDRRMNRHLFSGPKEDGGRLNPGEFSFDTAPPAPSVGRRLRSTVTRGASAVILPVLQRAARAYVGGETIEDALIVARRLAKSTFNSTLGYWNVSEQTGPDLVKIYLATIERLSSSGLDSYISIKPPALRFDSGIAAELASAAQAHGVRLHCDSHGREVADPSCAFAQKMLDHLPPSKLGTTLPGRWVRSLKDVDWVVERGLNVRVVKGEWPDPDDPDRDMRAGYLEVIDQLAGRARHVAVATHELPLAVEAITRLRRAGTSCELEMIHGMPIASAVKWAGESSVAVRIYVPFGRGYIPNALGVLVRNPRLLWPIATNLFAARPTR